MDWAPTSFFFLSFHARRGLNVTYGLCCASSRDVKKKKKTQKITANNPRTVCSSWKSHRLLDMTFLAAGKGKRVCISHK